MNSLSKSCVAVLLVSVSFAAQAVPVTYNFNWAGSGGITMSGHFSFDDSSAGDGAIRDGEVTSLFFEGFNAGVSLGSNSIAHTLAGFNFNFDAVLGQFFLNGNSNDIAGQDWNLGDPGLGFGAGSVASTLTLNGGQVGVILNPVPLTAERAVQVPEPTMLSLLGVGIAGLLAGRRRTQKRTR
jgi:hypothetical protein